MMDEQDEAAIRRIVRVPLVDRLLVYTAVGAMVLAIIGLLVALAHAAPTPTPRHHLTIHEKMQRDRITTRNLGPHDPRPAPRTNVPPTVPLQFLPSVKP